VDDLLDGFADDGDVLSYELEDCTLNFPAGTSQDEIAETVAFHLDRIEAGTQMSGSLSEAKSLATQFQQIAETLRTMSKKADKEGGKYVGDVVRQAAKQLDSLMTMTWGKGVH